MKHVGRSIVALVATLLLLLAAVLKGDDNAAYFAVGEVDVPNFTAAAKALGAFAEKVKPGTSMMLAGGAMALSFKYPGFDFNSGIRAIGYANSNDPLKKSRFAIILKPSGTVEIKDRFKSGDKTLFVKKIGGKVMLSDSIDFLATFKKLPAAPNLSADVKGIAGGPIIYLESFPAKLLSKAGDSIPEIKALLAKSKMAEKSLPADLKPNDPNSKSESESAAETFLKQCESIETRIYASDKALVLHFTLIPVAGSKFQQAMKPLKGDMTYKALDDMVSKAVGDPKFRLAAKFNKLVNSLSGETKDGMDTKTLLAALPKLRFSARNSRLLVEYRLPPETLRKVLLDAGVLTPEEKNNAEDAAR